MTAANFPFGTNLLTLYWGRNARGAEAIRNALHMTQRERVCRWSDMMQSLREHDVSWWAGAFLAALKRGSPSALQSVHISGSPFQHAPDVRQPTS